MGGAKDVRARGMDGGMDHEGGRVEEPSRAGLVQDISVVVDEQEILGLDEREMQALMARCNGYESCNLSAILRHLRKDSPRNNRS